MNKNIAGQVEFRSLAKRRSVCKKCCKLKLRYLGITKICIDCVDLEEMVNKYASMNINSIM